jgi:RHS repeat-associated protein
LIAVTDPEVGTIQYEYDLFGTKTKVIYPNGWQVRYEYRFKMIEQRIWKGENDCDPIPALTKVIDPLGYEITYNYSPWVQLQKSEAIIEKDANGNPTKKLIAEFVWDTENMLLSVDWKVNDQRVRKFAYTYDDLRNRIRQEMTEGDGKVESYEYDELNRLVRVTYPDGVVQSYTFDGVGNRLTKTEQFPDGTVKTTSYAYNALNQLVSLTDENGTRVFSYDANGNCVNDGKRLYEWDVQNRLIRVIVPNEGEVRFRYRADGMRVEKQVVGGLTTKYVYDGQTVIGEIRSDGTKRWYVPGAMGYVCRIDEGANGEILARDYFVYDGLGSCRALVSSNGIVVAKYDYDVYGSVRGQEGQRANSFKYVAQIGHPTDEETGLIYMRARYYDPEIGRFISEDPGFNRVNWYQYADGNPVNRLDGNGRSSAAIDALFGNLFIILGFLLMGDNVEINWDKVFDYVRAKLVEIVIFSWEEEPKVLAKWTNFAWDMIKMLKELDEIDVSGKAFTRWLGYYITIMGQMLLTEADIAEPGFYDWWGYDVVSNKWFP